MNKKLISAFVIPALFLGTSTGISAASIKDPGSMLKIKSSILLSEPADKEYDFNNDSSVDIFDLIRVKSGLLADDNSSAEPEPVPEPETETGRFVYRLYHQLLCCEPDRDEAEKLTAQLEENSITAADMMLGFMARPEYISRDVSDNDYVTMMYNVILGRDPDDGGYQRWCEKARYFSRRYIMRGFILSTEFSELCQNAGMLPGTVEISEPRDQEYEITRSVGQMYARILGTDLSADELNSITKDIIDRKLTLQIAAFNITEHENFPSDGIDDIEFINRIFSGLIDRAPEESELGEYSKYLAAGSDRSNILRRLAASENFYELYVSRGLRGNMKRIGSNFKLNGVWYHFDKSGDYYPVENETLLSLLNRSEDIFSRNGDNVTQIYNYCINDSRYKYIELTKTEEQIESIGWTYFADYAFNNYYSVCYYMAAEMDFLLEQSGYRCRIVHATHESGDHYWNQVYINGSWLNYDVTNWWAAYTWDQMVAAGNYVFISYVRPEYK